MTTPHDPHGFINVPLGKGCILRLPLVVYAAGLKAGKAYLRATAHAARVDQRQAEREAQRLAWVDDTLRDAEVPF